MKERKKDQSYEDSCCPFLSLLHEKERKKEKKIDDVCTCLVCRRKRKKEIRKNFAFRISISAWM
ncbi:hypothetical protein CSUI_005894 [Cystoisospora suis]|uniref:Uncharacterized protein n=1 Tax=Cystoisospora suis TaxID=483139 RepID=A0A2C6K3H0_9APIC|nr:hypothetical protein CSUI_005894 [Cystoisospora suis]